MEYRKSLSSRNPALKVTGFSAWEDCPETDLEDFETLGSIAECFQREKEVFCLEKMKKAFTVEREFMRKFDCRKLEGFK